MASSPGCGARPRWRGMMRPRRTQVSGPSIVTRTSSPPAGTSPRSRRRAASRSRSRPTRTWQPAACCATRCGSRGPAAGCASSASSAAWSRSPISTRSPTCPPGSSSASTAARSCSATESFPLAEILLADMIAKAEAGRYQAKPVPGQAGPGLRLRPDRRGTPGHGRGPGRRQDDRLRPLTSPLIAGLLLLGFASTWVLRARRPASTQLRDLNAKTAA
jgi:hypothetical protein